MSQNNLITVYDTETTGIWDFKAPWNAEHQPNLVQLGLKVYTPDRKVVFETGRNVNTTSFKSWKGVEPGAEAIHGISEAILREWGEDPQEVARQFMYWAERSRIFVAHNEQFDSKIMQCFLYRAGFNPTFKEDKESYCTMTTSTNICQIPNPNGRGGFKWPKLNEAYPFFCGKPMDENAHNALVDVNACGEIFWRHVERQMVAHIDTEGFTHG